MTQQMTHEQFESRLSAYVDGELEPIEAAEVERHVATCASCPARVAAYRALSSSVSQHLRRAAAESPAPEALRRRVAASLQARPARLPGRWRWQTRVAAAGLAAALLVAAGIGGGVLASRGAITEHEEIAREVLDSHVRSLAGDEAHLTDVTSTDQHTVKPYFTGKLDFGPTVVDLVDQGFPLIGGRVDYIDGHQAAALVYRRRQHVINLYEWPLPGPEPDANLTSELRRGYTMLHWTHAGTAFWAVSDVNPADLRQFAGNLATAMR